MILIFFLHVGGNKYVITIHLYRVHIKTDIFKFRI